MVPRISGIHSYPLGDRKLKIVTSFKFRKKDLGPSVNTRKPIGFVISGACLVLVRQSLYCLVGRAIRTSFADTVGARVGVNYPPEQYRPHCMEATEHFRFDFVTARDGVSNLVAC